MWKWFLDIAGFQPPPCWFTRPFCDTISRRLSLTLWWPHRHPSSKHTHDQQSPTNMGSTRERRFDPPTDITLLSWKRTETKALGEKWGWQSSRFQPSHKPNIPRDTSSPSNQQASVNNLGGIGNVLVCIKAKQCSVSLTSQLETGRSLSSHRPSPCVWRTRPCRGGERDEYHHLSEMGHHCLVAKK